jgi:putative monooxygenase
MSTPGPRVFRHDEPQAIDRGHGILSHELAGLASGAEQLLTGMTLIPPATAIPWHTHDHEEFILVVEGRASFETENGPTSVQALDATFVPAGVAHRYVNSGTKPLRILWVYPSPHTRRTLIEGGESRGHLDPYD